MSSVSGTFEAMEIVNSARNHDGACAPFPFLQSDLYKASQPGESVVHPYHFPSQGTNLTPRSVDILILVVESRAAIITSDADFQLAGALILVRDIWRFTYAGSASLIMCVCRLQRCSWSTTCSRSTCGRAGGRRRRRTQSTSEPAPPRRGSSSTGCARWKRCCSTAVVCSLFCLPPHCICYEVRQDLCSVLSLSHHWICYAVYQLKFINIVYFSYDFMVWRPEPTALFRSKS